VGGLSVFGEGSPGGEALVWREVQPLGGAPEFTARATGRPVPRLLTVGEGNRPLRGYISAATVLPGTDGAAISTARDFVTATLKNWGIPRTVRGDLLLIVSELATNAVRHAPGPVMRVELVLSYDGVAERVFAVVADSGQGFRWPSHDVDGEAGVPDLERAEGGRGLFLVDAFSTRCGAGAFEGGAAVWAQIDLSPRASPDAISPSFSLPVRSPHGTTEDGDDDAPRAHPHL